MIIDLTDGPCTYVVDVVGESRYQNNLDRICGPKSVDGSTVYLKASALFENDNPHDSSAVKIEIDGLPVGYLPGQFAPIFRDAVRRINAAAMGGYCMAMVVGGWDRGDGDIGQWGVKLDLPGETVSAPTGGFVAPPPPKPAKRIPVPTIDNLVHALAHYLPTVSKFTFSGHVGIDCSRELRTTYVELYGQIDQMLGRRIMAELIIDDKAATSMTSRLWAEKFIVRINSADLNLKFDLVIEPQADRSIAIFKVSRWENGQAFFSRV